MLYKIATTISHRKKQAILLFLDLSLVIVAFFGSEALLSSAAATPFAPFARLEFLIAGFCAAAASILHLGLHRMKLNAYEAQGMTDTVLVAGAVGAAVVVALATATSDPTGTAPLARFADEAVETGGGNNIVYFMTIENARFRRPVRPGDRLEIHVKKQHNRGQVWKFSGEARVDGKVAAQASYSAMIVDKA